MNIEKALKEYKENMRKDRNNKRKRQVLAILLRYNDG